MTFLVFSSSPNLDDEDFVPSGCVLTLPILRPANGDGDDLKKDVCEDILEIMGDVWSYFLSIDDDDDLVQHKVQWQPLAVGTGH